MVLGFIGVFYVFKKMHVGKEVFSVEKSDCKLEKIFLLFEKNMSLRFSMLDKGWSYTRKRDSFVVRNDVLKLATQNQQEIDIVNMR